MKKVLKQIYRTIIRFLPSKIVYNIDNLRGYHKLVSFKNPKYFGEKIHSLKLSGQLEHYDNYVDKYKVREHIQNTIGSEYLIPLLGVYNTANEIDYDSLPLKFVLKINNGSGYNIVVKNKNELNIDKTNKILNKWLREDYSKIKKEPQYKNVKQKILIEKYMEDSNNELNDYKFYCFDGKMEFVEVDVDRFTDHKMNFYNKDWELLDLKKGNYEQCENCEKPKNYEKMIELAEKLAKDFQFVRVDMYNLDGDVYFGELTFTPASGLTAFSPLEKDIELANKIKIKPKVLYIGSLGERRDRKDGVTVKANTLKEFLLNNKVNLRVVDVDNYKKRPIKILLQILRFYRWCDKLIICTSSPGASILLKFLYFIKCKKEIYYFVSGGSLGDKIEEGKYNIKIYKNIHKIYVESEDMLKQFNKISLKQTEKINNFRVCNYKIDELKKVDHTNIKFVFFARLIKEKGIEDAIEIVKKLTDENYNITFDIYGQGNSNYISCIKNIIKDYNNINYKGVIIPNRNNEYEILSEYDVLLFPTKYYGEGLPGTIIDACFSGLAIVASNWKYANEFIDDNKNGMIYQLKNNEDFYNKIVELIHKKHIDDFKKHSLELSKKYDANIVLKDFLRLLENK